MLKLDQMQRMGLLKTELQVTEDDLLGGGGSKMEPEKDQVPEIEFSLEESRVTLKTLCSNATHLSRKEFSLNLNILTAFGVDQKSRERSKISFEQYLRIQSFYD